MNFDELRQEMRHNKPDVRAAVVAIADHLDVLNDRINELEKRAAKTSPAATPEVRQAEPPELRTRDDQPPQPDPPRGKKAKR